MWKGGVEFKPIDGIIYQVIFNSSCWTKTDDAIYLHQLYRLNHKCYAKLILQKDEETNYCRDYIIILLMFRARS